MLSKTEAAEAFERASRRGERRQMIWQLNRRLGLRRIGLRTPKE